MDENLEQCSEQRASESTNNDVVFDNQEAPETLKTKVAAQTEARRLGQTNSSLDLPKIDLADFDKWKGMLAAESSAQTSPESIDGEPLVCKEEDPSKSEKTAEPARTCESEPKDPHAGQTPVSTEKDELGRPIREKFASGPDLIIAYDENGQAHRIVNEPIEEMPPDFNKVPAWRESFLDNDAKDLIGKYGGQENTGEAKILDFQKVADLQKEIAARQDLTETEKCLLYSKVQNIMHDEKMTIQNWNEKPEMVDSWMGHRDPWHAIAPLDDRYHNRLVNMTPEEATKAIDVQEDHTEGDMHKSEITKVMWKTARHFLGKNEGDVNASEAQLKCMRQLREKGTFAAYANEWEKQFVNKDAKDPNPPRDGRGGGSIAF